MRFYCISILLLVATACHKEKRGDVQLPQSVEQRLLYLTQQLTNAEAADDLATFIGYYDAHAISMPEYQLTLDGRVEIESFYKEIFARQDIRSFQREAQEFIHMDSVIVEIGTFKKEYSHSEIDSTVTLAGKYWNIWRVMPDGSFRIKGEAFGYFHHVADPQALLLDSNKQQPDESAIQIEIPFELKAYNALMEKGVRTRDGILRASFFTDDGSFFPFADTAVTGMDQIKPYLIAYSNRGVVTIDSIMCYTYAFERLGNYILEYDMFKVTWRVPDHSGRTEGKGIRIWKRQSDQSLRLYREIGTHNHLP